MLCQPALPQKIVVRNLQLGKRSIIYATLSSMEESWDKTAVHNTVTFSAMRSQFYQSICYDHNFNF